MGKNSFNGDKWFNEKVEARTKKSLAQLEKMFRQEHAMDSDEELLEYVRKCAEELEHTPHPIEVLGGKYITQRFGDWGRVIVAAKLPPTSAAAPALKRCDIYKKEFKLQSRLFKKEREAEKVRRAEEQRQNAAAQQEELRMRTLRDMTWGLEHEGDTDEELLEYVHLRAAEIGYSPRVKDVYGAMYIVQRIGNWGMVLKLAGLKIPRDVKRPRESEIDEYYRRKAEAKDREDKSAEKYITVSLTEKEMQVIRCLREAEDGEAVITVEDNEPCQVDLIRRNIPLE